jgi:alpha-beta hydrolase superfamily lysophospholipase
MKIVNNELCVYIWDEVQNPKAVIQVSHGLNEHGNRYDEFGKYMNKNGYIVYMEDHVSQGRSRTENEETVYFGKKGDMALVSNLIYTKELIKKEYPHLPVFVFGHSLGTSIIRRYIQVYGNDYDGVILNGGGVQKITGMSLVIVFGRFLSLFKAKKPSKFFDNMFRQTQLKLLEKVELNHFIQWLTRDEEINQSDLNDPYLFIRVSVSSFVDMLTLIRDVNKRKNIEKGKHEKPILLMSGTHDPATNFGEGIKDLHKIYKSLGYNSHYKLYENGRHDTLREINRLDVFEDIVTFIGGHNG